MNKKVKKNRNDLFRFKLEHENIPIVDEKVNGFSSLRGLFKKMEEKFDGKKK